MEKKEKVVTEREIKAYFKAHPHLKRRLTEDEIIKIKVDFIRAIMPNRTFKSKSEIKERLVVYRDLFAIRNDTERELVNSMIMIASNIPDELIEKKEIKEKEVHVCSYVCPTCGEQMFDMQTFPRTSYGRNIISDTISPGKTKRVVELEWKHLSCPNEYQIICLNRNNYLILFNEVEEKKEYGKCPRYGVLMDKAILDKVLNNE